METSLSLLERLRTCPDAEAWERLDRLYRPFIRNSLRQDPRLINDVDDLTQIIPSFICGEIGTFSRQRTGSFRKWLRMIMVNRVRDFLRKQGPSVPVGTDEWLVDLADDRSDLAQRWDQEHNAHIVQRMLDWISTEFSETHLQAFRRVVLEESTAAEVAEKLGLTPNAVLLAKSRILCRLREIGKEFLE